MTSAAKFKFLLLYGLFALAASLTVAFVLNPDLRSARSPQAFDSTHPEAGFFVMSPFEPDDIRRPEPDEIRQFRNGASRLGAYDVTFDPDRLRLVKKNLGEEINLDAHTASKSSPIGSESFLVLAGDQGLVRILRKEDFSPHWKIELFDSNMGFHGTPVTFGDFMIAGDYSGKLYFMDLKNRRILWVTGLGGGLGATPFFDGRHVYANVELSFPANGYLVKIDPFEKKVLWRTSLIGEQSHSSPALSRDGLFFGDNDEDLYRLNPFDGKVVWKVALGLPIKSTPSLFGNQVIFSAWDRSLYSLDQGSGRLNWRHPLPNTNQSSLAVDVESATGYLNSSEGVHQIDLRTGKELSLFRSPMGSASRKASPVLLIHRGKKRIVTPCARTGICVLDPNRLRLVRKFELGAPVSNQVGVLESSLVVLPNSGSDLFILE